METEKKYREKTVVVSLEKARLTSWYIFAVLLLAGGMLLITSSMWWLILLVPASYAYGCVGAMILGVTLYQRAKEQEEEGM